MSDQRFAFREARLRASLTLNRSFRGVGRVVKGSHWVGCWAYLSCPRTSSCFLPGSSCLGQPLWTTLGKESQEIPRNPEEIPRNPKKSQGIPINPKESQGIPNKFPYHLHFPSQVTSKPGPPGVRPQADRRVQVGAFEAQAHLRGARRAWSARSRSRSLGFWRRDTRSFSVC